MGREYIQSGQLIENFFSIHQIRFIAIDDNIDLDPADEQKFTNMLIPFYNLMNEFYPMDVSRKTKSALRTKANNGEYIAAYAPFGYKKSPTDKNKLIVDDEYSKWVIFIFAKLAEGWSLSKIARELHTNNVPTPKDIRQGTTLCQWTTSSLINIANNITYVGSTVFGKTKKISYKNKCVVKVPKEKWIICPNTHEVIINEKLFDDVQNILKLNKRCKKNSVLQAFSGKLKCCDCGATLNFTREPRKSNENEGYFVCRTNRRYGKSECSRHYIRYSILENAVLKEISILYSLALKDRF